MRRIFLLMVGFLALTLHAEDDAERRAPEAFFQLYGRPFSLTAPDPSMTFTGPSSSHNCRIVDGGRADCWGLDNDGQTDPPESIENVQKIATGGNHTCVLMRVERPGETRIECFGDDALDQHRAQPQRTDATQIVSGKNHSCLITARGAFECWGDNRQGQSRPTEEVSDVLQITAGDNHTCALRRGGRVTCWGNWVGPRTAWENLRSVLSISAGARHTCAIVGERLADGGTVECWGDNSHGQKDKPVDLGRVTKLVGGGFHNCAVRVNGTIRCWGGQGDDMRQGQTGLPSNAAGPVTSLSLGRMHTFATIAGRRECWGHGSNCWGERRQGEQRVQFRNGLGRAVRN